MVQFFQSKIFKWIMVILGMIFIIGGFFIAFNPDEFTKFGYVGVFVFNLFGPGTLIIPSLSLKMNVFWLAFVSALGISINDTVSYLVGKNGDVVFKRTDKIKKIESAVDRFGPFGLFVFAVFPFPYDFIGLLAGYLELSYKKFVIPCFLGKFLRFYFLGLGVKIIF